MENPGSDVVLFFGRFHPLALHLPIGFLVLACILETFSRFPRFAYLRPAVGVVLAFAAATAIVAAVLGYMLSTAEDYSSQLLGLHKWYGVGVCIATCGALALRKFSGSMPRLDKAYLFWMSVAMVFLIVAGHYGGSLTHGSDYLTEYMPSGLRSMAGLPEKKDKPVKRIANLEEALVYDDVIYPILDSRCISCHNEDKRKGELVMHTREGLMKGGKDGAVVVPGHASRSDMIRRIRLPERDDDHMPPEGKTQLTDEQATLLTWWIEQGAPFDKKVAEVKASDTVRNIFRALADPDANKTAVEKLLASAVRTATPEVIATLKRKGIRVRPLAADVHWLQADLPVRGGEPVDSLLSALRSVSDQLTWLDLGGLDVTDTMLTSISGLRNLTQLHLENTAITDRGLKHLQEFPYLEYLNLYGTQVTSQGIQTLATLKNLRQLYLWQTHVTPEGAAALQALMPAARVDVGLGGEE